MSRLDPGYWHEDELRGEGFAAVGKDVRIAKTATVVGAHNIRIGDHVRIDGYTTIVAAGEDVSLGMHVHIGPGCVLIASEGLVMEDFSGLSSGVKIYTRSDDYSGQALTNPTVPAEFTNVERGRVRLGRHVIVGAGAVILPGVEIGEGAAVGALSLVTRSLAGWSIYSGVPARRVGPRSNALLAAETRLMQPRTRG
jgi:acetyltransferase-like isoleucine patch superfamily enzyme